MVSIVAKMKQWSWEQAMSYCKEESAKGKGEKGTDMKLNKK